MIVASGLDDFEQVTALVRVQCLRPPIVEDEQINPGDLAERSGVSTISARQGQSGE
jgi:hypothetical protein